MVVETGEHLFLVGASVRAAAFSALRAGLRPWCADLFADADLQARCRAGRLMEGYPHAFCAFLATDAPGPWLYTGGLENWPTLVWAMSRRRPLWGNNESELVRARNPFFVTRILHAAGLPAPACRRNPDDLPPGFHWLVKPLRRAGGTGILCWDEGVRARFHSSGGVFWQEFIEGEPCSAVYVGDGRNARFLGLTRQLVGLDWLHAAPFQYCGSIGPLVPSEAQRRALSVLGTVVGRACGLRGLFGVDAVESEDVFWPVEINPRYTASVEVLEYATGLGALAWQAWTFGADVPAATLQGTFPAQGFVGKAFLFARAPLTFPQDGPWTTTLTSPVPVEEMPPFADIPHAGQRIEASRPILTFFARAASPDACETQLRDQAAALDRWLYRG
jgi:predicted ATP-grasp superfamily ATP-dependent carboligase